ncbi:MAG TPA: hypothetical protein VGG44_00415 [Tepidisphaeraceae bacterium]|jgi:hypothetical protein
MDNWSSLFSDTDEQRPLNSVTCAGTEIRPGDHVILRPMGRADCIDIALDGKAATVLSIEQDFEDRILLAVTVDDDPGRELGQTGQPGHRFFFGIDEIEPRTPDPK